MGGGGGEGGHGNGGDLWYSVIFRRVSSGGEGCSEPCLELMARDAAMEGQGLMKEFERGSEMIRVKGNCGGRAS